MGRGVKLTNAAHGTGGKSVTYSKRGQREKKTEPRQQLKHKRNVAIHQISAKHEHIRHQEWIVQQGVNKAAAKK
jgi:hypothetical protein